MFGKNKKTSNTSSKNVSNETSNKVSDCGSRTTKIHNLNN